MTYRQLMTSTHKPKNVLLTCVRVLCFACSLVLVPAGVYFALVTGWSGVDRIAAATLCLSLGVVLLMISIADQFELIKGAGIELKLRARIEQAQGLVDRLNVVAEMSARSLLEVSARATLSGIAWRSGSRVLADYAQAMKVKADLVEMLSDDALVRRALGPWLASYAMTVCFRASSEVSMAMTKAMPLRPSSPEGPSEPKLEPELDCLFGPVNEFRNALGVSIHFASVDDGLAMLRDLSMISKGAGVRYYSVVDPIIQIWSERLLEAREGLILSSEQQALWPTTSR